MDENALLMALLRSQVCGFTPESMEAPAEEQLKKLYDLANRQDLAHIVGQALGELKLLGQDETSQKLKNAAMQAIYRYVQLSYELGQSCRVLDEENIPFIPLKGSVLRAYYPEPWMRTSCDVDILVQEKDLDRAVEILKEKLHYQGGSKGDHDVFFRSPGGTTLELHYDTIQERYANNTSRDVLAEIWQEASPIKEGSSHMVLSDPMFYFYHIAHMAKHFEVGGCGVRPFLDIWILNHQVAHDQQARNKLLAAGGLLKFARAAEKLSEVWFSGVPMDDRSKQLNDYILRAGLYGDFENRAALGQARKGGKLRYVLTQRVFLPYDYLKAEYPVLQKHKWLTPVYQVVRWFRALRRGEWNKRARELQINAGISREATASAADMLRYLGLEEGRK